MTLSEPQTSSGLRVLLVLAAFATGLAGAETVSSATIAELEPAWRPLFRGVDLTSGATAEPVAQAVYAVRIDLAEPTVSFLSTPSNGDRPKETDGRKTTAFLREFGLQLAINASPYEPVLPFPRLPRDIQGLAVSRGDAYSGAFQTRAAILITRDNQVAFSRPPFDLTGVYHAVGGFGLLIEDGKNVGRDGPRHPRTAVGASENGRYLYLLILDGRQGDYSAGATTAETAAWLQRLGAHDGLNLDGGGSTTLVIDDGSGGAKIVNRPIQGGVPGAERVVGNHLGVFARTLGGPAPRGEP